MLKTVRDTPPRHAAYTPWLAGAFAVEPRRRQSEDRLQLIHIREYAHSMGTVPRNAAVACCAPSDLRGSNREIRPAARFFLSSHILCTGARASMRRLYVYRGERPVRTLSPGACLSQARPAGVIHTPAANFCENHQNASCGFVRFRIDHGHQRGGRLAQLVERLVYTEDVGGSSPSSPTIFSQELVHQPFEFGAFWFHADAR